jgi:hypothetical protein
MHFENFFMCQKWGIKKIPWVHYEFEHRTKTMSAGQKRRLARPFSPWVDGRSWLWPLGRGSSPLNSLWLWPLWVMTSQLSITLLSAFLIVTLTSGSSWLQVFEQNSKFIFLRNFLIMQSVYVLQSRKTRHMSGIIVISIYSQKYFKNFQWFDFVELVSLSYSSKISNWMSNQFLLVSFHLIELRKQGGVFSLMSPHTFVQILGLEVSPWPAYIELRKQGGVGRGRAGQGGVISLMSPPLLSRY